VAHRGNVARKPESELNPKLRWDSEIDNE
jgi:hypothetical protein